MYKFWKYKVKQFIISGKSACQTAKVSDAKTKIQLNINYTYHFWFIAENGKFWISGHHLNHADSLARSRPTLNRRPLHSWSSLYMCIDSSAHSSPANGEGKTRVDQGRPWFFWQAGTNLSFCSNGTTSTNSRERHKLCENVWKHNSRKHGGCHEGADEEPAYNKYSETD